MASGTVQVWSAGRGSGWIRPDSGGTRVYVHKSGIESAEAGRAPKLEQGQRVEYQLGQRPKGTAAINVRPLAVEPAPEPVAAES
ncbi:MAG: cold shock domain-containing protein [Chloroflexota bacterium]|nr:cold shock domain-containing protein [Chloroflexota bacterium]